MTAFGASRPLPWVPAKVRLLNRLPTLGFGIPEGRGHLDPGFFDIIFIS